VTTSHHTSRAGSCSALAITTKLLRVGGTCTEDKKTASRLVVIRRSSKIAEWPYLTVLQLTTCWLRVWKP